MKTAINQEERTENNEPGRTYCQRIWRKNMGNYRIKVWQMVRKFVPVEKVLLIEKVQE